MKQENSNATPDKGPQKEAGFETISALSEGVRKFLEARRMDSKLFKIFPYNDGTGAESYTISITQEYKPGEAMDDLYEVDLPPLKAELLNILAEKLGGEFSGYTTRSEGIYQDINGDVTRGDSKIMLMPRVKLGNSIHLTLERPAPGVESVSIKEMTARGLEDIDLKQKAILSHQGQWLEQMKDSPLDESSKWLQFGGQLAVLPAIIGSFGHPEMASSGLIASVALTVAGKIIARYQKFRDSRKTNNLD